MAKQSGLGANFYIAGYDLSGDVNSFDQISGGPAPLDVTGIKSSAPERIGGLRTGDMQFTSWFNPSTEHPVLSALPTSDVITTAAVGTTVGAPAACMVGKQLNYDGTRGADGSFSFKVECQSNSYGLEWGDQLTPGLLTAAGGTAATHGTAVDGGSATSFGAQAYLQVTALSGSAATIIVEHSTDNSTFGTLATFTVASTAPTFERITTGTTTVNQYVRASSTQPGTASTCTYSVVNVRNQTAVVF